MRHSPRSLELHIKSTISRQPEVKSNMNVIDVEARYPLATPNHRVFSFRAADEIIILAFGKLDDGAKS